MNRIQKTARRYPVISVSLAATLLMILFHFLPVLSIDGISVGTEGLMALISCGVILLLGGRQEMKFSVSGRRQAMHAARYYLGITFFICICSLMPTGHGTLRSDWLVRIPVLMLFVLFVGIFEESVFRSLLLNGFLAKHGKTWKGLLLSLILSSVCFGIIHVLSSFLSGAVTSADQAILGLLKVVAMTEVGFFIGAVYIRTQNIWNAILIHMLNDFMALLSFTIYHTNVEYSYIGTSDHQYNMMSIIVYLIMVAMYIPLLRSGYKLLKDTPLPWYGYLSDRP
ncbi:MAG: CPBP family intramembrane glutamic endopeptidase [Catenisphaera adipataccumulans]|jgi:membrane protease YdiL (CAAX protease family)|uniref:CPBP family intramembrane glutamic endopeptidase n=1 Tax=Catenisphaera adipataccumulans TaxID=700500 RepID=UPI003D8E8A5D